MAITWSKSVQIKRVRCLLTSTENVDAKKHLISSIWTIFDEVMAISKLLEGLTELRSPITIFYYLNTNEGEVKKFDILFCKIHN